jgi:hypothetical protein
MSDLHIELNYSISEKSATIAGTNIKESYIDDFLAEVVHSQVGKEKDFSKAKELEVYNILLKCDLSYDKISISSNTGNKGLTDGILTHTIGNWKFSKSLLEEMAKSPDFIGPPKPKKGL